MKFLVTAGPTREPIDPVRFISNRSSGKMGYAVARAASQRGHEVVLVSGPVSVQPVAGVTVVHVETAEEMCAAVRARVEWCDALVMAAAVADWRPARVSGQKMKKDRGSLDLSLEPTPDILRSMATLKGARIFVGFAAETETVVEEATRKLREKNLDLIVANDVSRRDSGFDSENNEVILLARDGSRSDLPLMSKIDVALRIVSWIESRRTS